MVGFLPRWISPVVWALIGATLTISLVAVIAVRAGFDAYETLALVPGDVWAGEVWRLATWPLVEASPWGLVSSCIALYYFGGQLAAAWGPRRFMAYLGGIALFAGVGTVVLARIVPGAWMMGHLGGFAMGHALVVAWALQFPEREIRVHVLLSLGGPLLAYGAVAMVVLYAFFVGVAPVLPALLAGVAALAYMNGGFSATARRLRSAIVELRARRRGMSSVDGGRHGGPFTN
jgi:membrane associated rhomboid family serine protease